MIEGTKIGVFKLTVSESDTAKAVKSGELEVLATPVLAAAMEAAAVDAVAGYLSDNETTVGSLLELKHTSPSVVGANISAKAEVTKIDGRKIVYEIQASDDSGVIGTAIHERYIVDKNKFMEKAAVRSENYAK